MIPAASRDLRLKVDGAQLVAGAASPWLDALERALNNVPTDRPGTRLFGHPELGRWVESGSKLAQIVEQLSGANMSPVRAILFNKRPDSNWPLGWHQDRTIAVRERCEVPGYGPWTRKAGVHHVAPPTSLLEQMITVRIHLDDVPHTNAPLLVALGSHRCGLIEEACIDDLVQASGVHRCIARRGDVWVYRTLILHASEPAAIPGSRRVLQVDYSGDRLPAPLRWMGI